MKAHHQRLHLIYTGYYYYLETFDLYCYNDYDIKDNACIYYLLLMFLVIFNNLNYSMGLFRGMLLMSPSSNCSQLISEYIKIMTWNCSLRFGNV